MKIIKTAAMKAAQFAPSVAPSATGSAFAPPQKAPLPNKPRMPQPAPAQADFEVVNENDLQHLEQMIGEMAAEKADVFQEGFDHAFGYHSMGSNYEIRPFKVTVKAVQPMTSEELPHTMSGSAQTDTPEGQQIEIDWNAARRDNSESDIATYVVGR